MLAIVAVADVLIISTLVRRIGPIASGIHIQDLPIFVVGILIDAPQPLIAHIDMIFNNRVQSSFEGCSRLAFGCGIIVLDIDGINCKNSTKKEKKD
jgi:hypothetical protein